MRIYMPRDDGELRGLMRMEMRGNTGVIANEIRSLFCVICSSQVPMKTNP